MIAVMRLPRRVMIAGLLALLCALFYSPHSPTPLLGDVFFMAAIAALWWTLRHDYPVTDSPAAPRVIPPLTRFDLALTCSGALCLWLMAEGGGPLLGVSGLWPLTVAAQMALFTLGALLVAAGLSGWRPFDVPRLPADAPALVVITLLAFAVRAWNLENTIHLFVDELHFAEAVTRLRADAHVPLLAPINYIAAFSWFYPAAQTLSADLFGSNLAALRIVSAVCGALTVPALYLLARALLDRPAALLAALVLAVFPPHVHFSRLGLNNIADPLFGTLALAALGYGLRRGGRAPFALAGVCLGLAQYFYEGGRLVYPLAALLWLALAYARDHAHFPRRAALIALVAFALVTAPWLYVQAAWDKPLLPRAESELLDGAYWSDLFLGSDLSAFARHIGDQIAPALLHYVNTPDGSAFYYGGSTALVLPFFLPFFITGMVDLVRRAPGGWVILLILLMVAGGNSLLKHPDWSARYVVTFPALALIIAAGMRAAWALVAPAIARPAPARRIALGLLVIIPLAYYFGPHLTLYNRQIRPWHDHQDAAWRLRALPAGTRAYLFTDDPVHMPHYASMAGYWGVRLHVVRVFRYLPPGWRAEYLPRRGNLALFVRPEDQSLLDELRRVFVLPPPRHSPYSVPDDRQYHLYFLSFGAHHSTPLPVPPQP